jgi:repressor LexA
MLVNLKDTDKKALNVIRNILVHEGRRPTLKEINDVTGGKSPRSATIVMDRLVRLGFLKRIGNNLYLTEKAVLNSVSIETVNIPLVGSIACGLPILAEENIEAFVPVSTNLAKKGSTYFLLRAVGDSMNEAGIEDGQILLVRQQNTGENGDRVVALINDEATVKVFERGNNAIILRPKSSNIKHKPIIVTENCQIQGIVIAVLPADLT